MLNSKRFFQDNRGKLQLNRTHLQEDLYTQGIYILDKYKSFNLYLSQETFRATLHKQQDRPRDYKGIYKYYFYVKSDSHFENKFIWQSWNEHYFNNAWDWYNYVTETKDLRKLVSLNWGAKTFFDWEKRYLKENPRFVKQKQIFHSEFIELLQKTPKKPKRKDEYLKAMVVLTMWSEECRKFKSNKNYKLDIKDYIQTIHTRDMGIMALNKYKLGELEIRMKRDIRDFMDAGSIFDYWDKQKIAKQIFTSLLEEKKGSPLNTMQRDAMEQNIWKACEDDDERWLFLLNPLNWE